MSEADRALWRAYAALVRPLPGRALPELPVVTAALAPAAPVAPLPPAPKPRAAPAELRVGAPPDGLDRRHWRELRRGKIRPERVLDLHGRRAQEAHAAVRGFLAACHAEGLRCVAIVTGKGATAEGGILKRELPHWLNAPELRPLLLGAAHPHAANAGAVHLLLRRKRPGGGHI